MGQTLEGDAKLAWEKSREKRASCKGPWVEGPGLQEEQQRPGHETGEEWMRSGGGARPCRASGPTVRMMAFTLREMGGVGAHFPYRILSRGIS